MDNVLVSNHGNNTTSDGENLKRSISQLTYGR